MPRRPIIYGSAPHRRDASHFHQTQVGTIGGAAFANLARELLGYATSNPLYRAVASTEAAVDGGAFVLWCLETLAKRGATLTPLARLERRVPTCVPASIYLERDLRDDDSELPSRSRRHRLSVRDSGPLSGYFTANVRNHSVFGGDIEF